MILPKIIKEMEIDFNLSNYNEKNNLFVKHDSYNMMLK